MTRVLLRSSIFTTIQLFWFYVSVIENSKLYICYSEKSFVFTNFWDFWFHRVPGMNPFHRNSSRRLEGLVRPSRSGSDVNLVYYTLRVHKERITHKRQPFECI